MSEELTTDEMLLKWYYKGFDDELKGTSSPVPTNPIFDRAYVIGAVDAMVDGVSSSDEQTEEDILKTIKRNHY